MLQECKGNMTNCKFCNFCWVKRCIFKSKTKTQV